MGANPGTIRREVRNAIPAREPRQPRLRRAGPADPRRRDERPPAGGADAGEGRRPAVGDDAARGARPGRPGARRPHRRDPGAGGDPGRPRRDDRPLPVRLDRGRRLRPDDHHHEGGGAPRLRRHAEEPRRPDRPRARSSSSPHGAAPLLPGAPPLPRPLRGDGRMAGRSARHRAPGGEGAGLPGQTPSRAGRFPLLRHGRRLQPLRDALRLRRAHRRGLSLRRDSGSWTGRRLAISAS